MHNKRKALIGKLFKTVLSCFIVLCTCFTLLPSRAVQSKTLYQEEPVQTTNEDQTQNEQKILPRKMNLPQIMKNKQPNLQNRQKMKQKMRVNQMKR